MKKLMIITLTFVSLLMFTGCEKSKSNYEKLMKEYSIKYYETLQKGTEGLTITKITLKQIRTAYEKGYINKNDYDMSKLENCGDESYAELTINQKDNSVSNVSLNLICQ